MSKEKIEKSSESLSLRNRVIKFFAPTGYPHTVTKDYWSVQKYWNIQWACSSAVNVFTTQSLLLGVGDPAATDYLVLSTTANWILKDVLACLGVMFVANKMGNYLDVNIKRSKWTADIFLVVGNMVELTVRVYPKYFLLLASTSVLLKSISGMLTNTTRGNVSRHFANQTLGKNLCDIISKAQSQGVFAYIVGLFYGISIVSLSDLYHMPSLVLMNFIGLCGLYLFSGYRLLSGLQITFLNEQRGKLVVYSYLSHFQSLLKEGNGILLGKIEGEKVLVLTPEQVASQETFIRKYSPRFPIVAGAPILDSVTSVVDIDDLLSRTKLSRPLLFNNTSNKPKVDDSDTFNQDDQDLIGEPPINNQTHERYLINFEDNKILLCFETKANDEDHLRALFHSLIVSYQMEHNFDASVYSNDQEVQAAIHHLLIDSHLFMENHFQHLRASLSSASWTDNYVILLQTKENPTFDVKFTL